MPCSPPLRGVKCQIMVDSAGSWHFFRHDYPEMMRNAGIEFVEALPVNILRFALRRMDLRQHRKIVTIDNYISLHRQYEYGGSALL